MFDSHYRQYYFGPLETYNYGRRLKGRNLAAHPLDTSVVSNILAPPSPVSGADLAGFQPFEELSPLAPLRPEVTKKLPTDKEGLCGRPLLADII